MPYWLIFSSALEFDISRALISQYREAFLNVSKYLRRVKGSLIPFKVLKGEMRLYIHRGREDLFVAK